MAAFSGAMTVRRREKEGGERSHAEEVGGIFSCLFPSLHSLLLPLYWRRSAPALQPAESHPCTRYYYSL